jgi:hypothetical protein
MMSKRESVAANVEGNIVEESLHPARTLKQDSTTNMIAYETQRTIADLSKDALNEYINDLAENETIIKKSL